MKKPRIFWGWYIVVSTVVLSAYNSGMFVYGFTAFIDPIKATFGWSYAQISLATSLRGLESGAMNPLLGVIVDRFSPRKLVLTGIIIAGFGILWISRVSSLLMFYVGFLILGLGGSLGIYMVPQTSIVKWFRRDVGKASGVSTMGMGISGALIPLTVMMIDAFGWQNTLVFLGFGMWLIGIPLSLIFRSRPEDYGLLPDGRPEPTAAETGGVSMYDFGTGVGEAMKMRAFWHIGLASIIQMGSVMAVITHMMPFLEGIGIEREIAGHISMYIPLVSLFARFPFGWMCDIFTKKYVMALALGLKCTGLLTLWFIGQGRTGFIVPFIIVFGLGNGGMMSPRTPILREYFGTRRFGTIFGIASVFITAGIVITPPLAGWIYDILGTYQPVWLTLSLLTFIGVITMVSTPPPSRRPEYPVQS
jgi:MFS family permease